MLQEAIELATKHHKWQFRKTGEEFIHHPISVMKILKELDFCEEILVCAVLHDVCEDTSVKNITIVQKFWERVWFIIEALSKIKSPNKKNTLHEYKDITNNERFANIQQYIDYKFMLYINKLRISITADPWIMFIKMADQIHNLSTLWYAKPKHITKKLFQVEEFFYPIYDSAESVISDSYLAKYHKLYNILKDKVSLLHIRVESE